MWHKIESFFCQNPGLLIIGTIISVISTASIKLQFYTIGWDNFSTSLNPFLNFPRTLFSTWRIYRGFGVPSDSEVTDSFRQLIYIVSSLLLPIPKNLLEQFYILFCLAIGTVSFYFLVKYLFQKFQFFSNPIFCEISASVSGIFYLFNLHTLETFYLPITMYVTRYAFFPLIILSFLKALYSERLGKKYLIYLLVVSWLGAASFLTGTIFVTFILILGTIGATNLHLWKRFILLLPFFLGINSFWLLPFANYTKEKSNLLPLASTFVDVNEVQLNQPESHFSWSRIFTYTPNFFYTNVKNANTNESLPLHELTNSYLNWSLEKAVLLFLPIFTVTGLVFIFGHKKWQLLWLPALLLISLVILRNIYPPFGGIYNFLIKNIPFFKIIFRFGASKFNPLLLLSSCILGSLGLTKLIQLTIFRASRNVSLVILGIILCLHGYTFRTFFSGKFISPQMYVKIPSAYFEIAKTINRDSENIRVIHLPMEKLSYWKTYSWGYVGSNFLSYLIDKPFIDRTWEPASIENDQFDLSLNSLVQNSQDIDSLEALNAQAHRFLTLLKRAGIKYIIFDETVGTVVPSRGLEYWGSYPKADEKKLLLRLKQSGLIKEVLSFPINEFKNQPPQLITLYQFKDYNHLVSSEQSAQVFDINQANLQESPLLSINKTVIQPSNQTGTIFPFANPKTILNKKESIFFLNLPGDNKKNYLLTGSPTHPPFIVNLLANLGSKNLTVEAFLQLTPQIDSVEPLRQSLGTISVPVTQIGNYLEEENSAGSYLSDWHVLGFDKFNLLRLKVGDIVLPLPPLSPNIPVSLGQVLVHKNTFSLEVLLPEKNSTIALDQFHFTDYPNCTIDKSRGDLYSYKAIFDKAKVEFSTQGGTSCIIQNLAPLLTPESRHIEISLRTKGNSPEENLYQTASVCLADEVGNCFNNHQTFELKSNVQHFLIPSSKSISGHSPNLLLKLHSQNNTQNSMNVIGAELHAYKTLKSSPLSIPVLQQITLPLKLNQNSKLIIPPVLSNSSFYFQPGVDGWSAYLQPCSDNPKQYRYTKLIENAVFLFQKDCYHGITVDLPFSSDNLTLWRLSYSLMAGQFPKFKLSDKSHFYKDELVSRFQGYPYVASDKSFHTASTAIYPLRGLNDTEKKLYTIEQSTQNEGLVAYQNLQIIPLPSYWTDLQLIPDSSKKSFTTAPVSAKQILPSFWKLTVQVPKDISDNKHSILLTFRQAYDKQWQLYQQSALLSFLGLAKPETNHLKVDGLFNGWEIPVQEGQAGKETVYYAFYWPERLAAIGWIVSFAVLTIGLVLGEENRNWKSRINR